MSVRSGYPIIVIKIGKICIVSGEVIAMQTWEGSGKNVGLELPPSIDRMWGSGVTYYNNGSTIKLCVDQYGNLLFQNGLKDKLYSFSIIYIVKE